MSQPSEDFLNIDIIHNKMELSLQSNNYNVEELNNFKITYNKECSFRNIKDIKKSSEGIKKQNLNNDYNGNLLSEPEHVVHNNNIKNGNPSEQEQQVPPAGSTKGSTSPSQADNSLMNNDLNFNESSTPLTQTASPKPAESRASQITLDQSPSATKTHTDNQLRSTGEGRTRKDTLINLSRRNKDNKRPGTAIQLDGTRTSLFEILGDSGSDEDDEDELSYSSTITATESTASQADEEEGTSGSSEQFGGKNLVYDFADGQDDGRHDERVKNKTNTKQVVKRTLEKASKTVSNNFSEKIGRFVCDEKTGYKSSKALFADNFVKDYGRNHLFGGQRTKGRLHKDDRYAFYHFDNREAWFYVVHRLYVAARRGTLVNTRWNGEDFLMCYSGLRNEYNKKLVLVFVCKDGNKYRSLGLATCHEFDLLFEDMFGDFKDTALERILDDDQRLLPDRQMTNFDANKIDLGPITEKQLEHVFKNLDRMDTKPTRRSEASPESVREGFRSKLEKMVKLGCSWQLSRGFDSLLSKPYFEKSTLDGEPLFNYLIPLKPAPESKVVGFLVLTDKLIPTTVLDVEQTLVGMFASSADRDLVRRLQQEIGVQLNPWYIRQGRQVS